MSPYDIPFVPSSDDCLVTMVELALLTPSKMAIDLGCGDGRVVIAMAKHGALAHGVDINPNRCTLTCDNLISEGLLGKAFISNSSIWDTDLSYFNVITIYGISSIMGRLEQKLQKETRPDTRFISNSFRLPNLTPAVVHNNVYLYLLPVSK